MSKTRIRCWCISLRRHPVDEHNASKISGRWKQKVWKRISILHRSGVETLSGVSLLWWVPASPSTARWAIRWMKRTQPTAANTYKDLTTELVPALVCTNKSLYRKIGNTVDEYKQTNRSKNLHRFSDGASPDDLWAVRSLGIDPATGREMFLKLTGEETFVHDYADEVKLGN